MTIYISLPITGYDENERREKCKQAKEYIRKKYGTDIDIVSPFEICDALRANIGSPTYGNYLGADVQFIIDEADAIFVITENGEFPESKGVRLEYTAAQLYGKKILFN